MRIFSLIGAIVGIGVVFSVAIAAPGDSAAYCQQEGRGSYAMEAYSLQREREAYDRIAARGRIEQRILDYCNPPSTSWASLDYCIRREEEAGSRLGRERRRSGHAGCPRDRLAPTRYLPFA